MPALLAYLLAVALLVGGGCEALSWLAAPQHAKVATRGAILRSLPPLPKNTEIAEETPRSQTEAGIAKTTRAPPEAQQDQQIPSNTKRNAAPTDSYRGNEAKETLQSSPRTEPTPAEEPQTASSVAPATTPVERPSARRTTRHVAAKHKYVMMTLRTIEFSDGRRMQRLIPFRGTGRYLAYLPEQ
jgi:hypothetical protein